MYGGPKLSRRYYELVSSITKLPTAAATRFGHDNTTRHER